MLDIINDGICPVDHRIKCRCFPACRDNCALLNAAQYQTYIVEYVNALKKEISELKEKICDLEIDKEGGE